MRHTLLSLIILLLGAAGALAQSGSTAVATSTTPVFIAPDASRTPLRTAAQGTVFTVLAEEGEWTKVQFKDPQWGVRVGYVATKHLRINRPELEPMDLSVPPAAVSTQPTAQPGVAPPVRAPRPWESAGRRRSFERGWIDVNVGAAWAAEKAFTVEANDTVFRETRTLRMSYENPTGASFDVGGGVMLTPQVGLGISLAGTAHQEAPQLFVSVPHPNFFNSSASDTSEADRKFPRAEGSVNIQLVGAAALGDRGRLRVFGGPTYFRVQQDLVSNVRYVQVFSVFTRANEVEITDYEFVEKIEGAGWGYHVGADVSFFFTRVVGIGGFARYGRGNVEVVEPLARDVVELRVGGFQTGGGLRLKF